MKLALRAAPPLCWLVGVILSGAPVAAMAQDGTQPRLRTNQAEIEEAARRTSLAIDDPLSVFAFVLASLPQRVKVYPTENYFYFSFVHNGVPYGGNIRLDASNRDEGKVSFGYSAEVTGWHDPGPERDATRFVVLDRSQGVTLEKLDRFLYRLSFRGRNVLFELNDLSGLHPPAGALAPDERYFGPVFDESGIRFFLVHNAKLKLFHYVLDETAPVADMLDRSQSTDRILIGRRTGFAFYRDALRDRKILIGVFFYNAMVNNYFDGPFDQLPDNFLQGEVLRDAILAIDPSLKGKIDRFGGSFDGEVRFMIAPYAEYQDESDLLRFHSCASARIKRPDAYYRCFDAGRAVPGASPPRRQR
jgi:hypothetical protein